MVWLFWKRTQNMLTWGRWCSIFLTPKFEHNIILGVAHATWMGKPTSKIIFLLKFWSAYRVLQNSCKCCCMVSTGVTVSGAILGETHADFGMIFGSRVSVFIGDLPQMFGFQWLHALLLFASSYVTGVNCVIGGSWIKCSAQDSSILVIHFD